MSGDLLVCTGQDGTSINYCIVVQDDQTTENSIRVIELRVHLPDFFETDDFFELHLKSDGDYLWIQSMMHRANKISNFSGRGIPEAAIMYAAQRFQKKIISTKKTSDDGNYYRNDEATKVWERLVSDNKATYLTDTDRYITV